MDFLRRFTDYLNSPQNHLSKKTVKNYRADLNSFSNWYKKQYNLELGLAPSKVTSQIVELYKKSKIQDSNLSAISLKRHLSSLRKFFQFLKTDGAILEDPFEQIKILQKNALALNDKWRLLSFRNYLHLHNKSNLTIKNYILDVRHFLAWTEQVTKQVYILSEINAGIVNEYKKRLLDHQFSPRTINRKLSSIRQYLNWATHESVIKPPSPKPLDVKVFSKETPSRRSLLIKNYSRFPPFRLMQKTLRGIGFLFDISLIVPLIKLTDALKSKPIFNPDIPNFTPQPESAVLASIPHISAIPKEFYAPLSISTRYFPWHKKAWHYIRHRRPNWYKRYHYHSVIHYFHLAILILFTSYLGFAIYQNITQNSQNQKSVLGTLGTAVPRILSFKGKLTDNLNNSIIVSATPLRMSIYNDETASGSSLLWQEVVGISTDSEGKFSTTLGNNVLLPQSLFAENQALWLGVAIGESPELTPREPLANVGLAANAEKLQGLTLITSPNSDTKNVVLALDSSGNLTIDADASPTFQATGGTFKLLGRTLFLSTTPGTNSNVEIAPMDLGKIDLQKPIFNSTNNNNIEQALGAVEINDSLAVLATSSAQAAFTINQTSTGKLISAYTGSIVKFAVDNNGNIISEEGAKWQPFSNSTSALNIANASGSTFVTFDTTNSKVVFLQDATERGAVFYQNSDSTFHMRSSNGLALDTNNSNTPKLYIATSGNVGIGTASPGFRLDVRDDQAASAAAQIFNTNTGTDADGLIVKLGNTSSTAVDNTNHFVSFETSGIGIVGSVQGNGGTGVTYATSGVADFAEYLKKDETLAIEYGEVLCIDDKGLVLPCDNNNNKIIGIASERPGFLGGENLGNKSIAVGLVGQVYARASTINGNIKPGDPLTSSPISGVAVKATSAGQIVGKAMEGFSSCHAGGSETTDSISPGDSIASLQNDSLCVGKILVVISVSWYDPGNLSDDTIISPIPEIDEIHTNIISPLASDSTAHLEGGRLARRSSAKPNEAGMDSFEVKTSIDNASASAIIESELAETKASTLAAQITEDNKILRYEDIKKEEKQSPNIDTFPQGLMAFGPTSLTDVSIIGQLSIGQQGRGFIITENSINAIGAILELQPLRQGALSLMGGLVYIDTNGDLKVDGNAEFAKDVRVGGDIIASGSGTFSKINLKLAKNALALSSKEIIATGSAGTAFVRANEQEMTINNSLVTDKSLIYITPAGTPSGQIPFLLRQVPDGTWLRQQPSDSNSSQIGSFTVGVQSPTLNPIPFNWLIIN